MKKNEYRKLNEIDLKLHLLSGKAIGVDNISINPYKISEIRDFGYVNYMNNLQWISLGIDDFISSMMDENKKSFLIEQKENLRNFDFYIKIGGKEVLNSLINSLKMILRTDDIRLLEDGVLAVNFVKLGILVNNGDEYEVDQEGLYFVSQDELTIIHRDNFDEIIEVIKLQNYLMKTEDKSENGENPANDEVKALMEHMKRMREKVDSKKKAQKSQDGDRDIDISDIISAVSSKSNSINKLNIWDISLYELYDEYARLEVIDSYEFSIKAMMAGADKVDLQHWSRKL